MKMKQKRKEAEFAEIRLKMDLDLFEHLIDMHDHTPREACEVVMRTALNLPRPSE